MAASTLVNGRTVVHRSSGGLLATFPDVCLTPSPGGPVPVPYPNVARSADLAQGTRTVTVDGSPLAVEDSVFSRSTGDEPGTQKGVLSHAQGGEARFLNWSFDVKAEGKGVCRLFDPMASNAGSPPNTSRSAVAQPNRAARSHGSPSLREVHVLSVRFHYGPVDVNTGRAMGPVLFLVGYKVQSAFGAEAHHQAGPPLDSSGRSDVPDGGAYALHVDPFDMTEPILKGSDARWDDVAGFAKAEAKRLEPLLKEISGRIKSLMDKAPSPGRLTLGLVKVRVDTARTRAIAAKDAAGTPGNPSRSFTSKAEYREAAQRASYHLEAVTDELTMALGGGPPVLDTAVPPDEARSYEWISIQDAIGSVRATAQAVRYDIDHELATYP